MFFREGDSLLLRVGVALMALAVALTVVAVVVSVVVRSEPGRVVAQEVGAKSSHQEPQQDYGSSYGAVGKREEKFEGPQPVVQQEAELPSPPETKANPIPGPQPKPEPSPTAQAKPESQPPQEGHLLPAPENGNSWPQPTHQELQSANSPRHYHLIPGAIMALTIEEIGIYNAPVFDSDGYWALVNGIGHNPQTSLPWSNTPQRNVYLSGHRMGFRGTWSRMIFYNLDKLAKGDRVVLRDRAGRTYEYEVSEVFLAEPTDIWVMGQVRGRDMLTLQTCTPIPTFEKRLIVRADRV